MDRTLSVGFVFFVILIIACINAVRVGANEDRQCQSRVCDNGQKPEMTQIGCICVGRPGGTP